MAGLVFDAAHPFFTRFRARYHNPRFVIWLASSVVSTCERTQLARSVLRSASIFVCLNDSTECSWRAPPFVLAKAFLGSFAYFEV